jgi:hypothetical protein
MTETCVRTRASLTDVCLRVGVRACLQHTTLFGMCYTCKRRMINSSPNNTHEQGESRCSRGATYHCNAPTDEDERVRPKHIARRDEHRRPMSPVAEQPVYHGMGQMIRCNSVTVETDRIGQNSLFAQVLGWWSIECKHACDGRQDEWMFRKQTVSSYAVNMRLTRDRSDMTMSGTSKASMDRSSTQASV